MPSYLICVGSAAERSLPVIFTALSCGAAQPVSPLHVFSFSGSETVVQEAASLAAELSACHRLTAGSESSFFPSSFTFASCKPVLRSVRELCENPENDLLISSLRGKGMPVSCQTDREAAEWCFTDLLARPDDPSVQPFFTWLSGIPRSTDPAQPVRIFLLAELSDPFSSGIVMALLSFLRKELKNASPYLSLLALEEASPPLSEAFLSTLAASLEAIDHRSLLRLSEEETPLGADALWLLSLPSSLSENNDSFWLPALAAARILGSACSQDARLCFGLHIEAADGTLSLSSLGNQALDFSSFLQASVWLVSDLLPALAEYLERPRRLHSITLNQRNALFRQLFPGKADFSEDLSQILSGLRSLLSIILRFIRSIPVSLRSLPENDSRWQRAVSACGRYITVASELDTSAAEAKESGLDSVRPVHRTSLADTDEEKLARRLQDMHQQLEEESRARNEAFTLLGGYRAVQVRLDCLSRCRSALDEAKLKASAPKNGMDNLAVRKLDRRVALLKSAVARCESELDPAIIHQEIGSLPKPGIPLSDPYEGTALNPESCRALERLLNLPPKDPMQRIPGMIPDDPAADPKQRLRTLSAACQGALPAHPLAFLLNKVLDTCHEDLSSFVFPSPGSMPSVALLPDCASAVPFLRIRDILNCLPAGSANGSDTNELRGLLAMLLLRQYRRRHSSEASLSCVCCRMGSSPVLDCWLSSNHADRVYILSLASEEVSLPFLAILPGRALLPARRFALHHKLVPSFAVWYNPENGLISDPCDSLGEGDRKLLQELLSAYSDALGTEAGTPLSGFLKDFCLDLSGIKKDYSPDPDLQTRMAAVCGLSFLSAYESSLSKSIGFYERFLPFDQIGSCLTGTDHFPSSPCSGISEDVLYLYRGVPFAREDSVFLLASPHASGEDYTLTRLQSECAVLSESSDDYRDLLQRNLLSLLDRFPSVRTEIRDAALELLKEAEMPLDRHEPEFVWPWDSKSPSMLTVLRESLGNSISDAALSPFSEGLTVFPARGCDIIGDSLLSSACLICPADTVIAEGAEISRDAVLPPLSEEFGKMLCFTPEGRTLLKSDFLHFEYFRNEDDTSDSVRVLLTLDGSFPIHLIRVYTPDEILRLYSHDIPTLALWPSVPFRPEDWHSYYLYAHLEPPYRIAAFAESGKKVSLILTSEKRYTAVLDSFPYCFSFYSGDKTIGFLPNMLPPPLLNVSDPVEVCVDFGSSGTSVVFSSGRKRRPMQGPVLVRTLLNNPSASRDLLRREFLPAVPVSALLPTVTRIFRNTPGKAPVPFMDGIILMSSSLEDLLSTPSDAIYTSLKWEEEKGRSGFLCLHQVLLMAALQARFEGASSLSWRFSLPDEMAKDGRESLRHLFLSLCESVLLESGFSAPESGLPVTFASESSALGAYFRFCASDDTRGGFMVLDIGSCTSDISLFMRGREEAVRTCQIPLGIHYILFPSLLKDPEMLSHDFGLYAEGRFSRDLSLLSRALSSARTDASALRSARIAFDYLIADYLPLFVSIALQLSSSGVHTRSGALVLLYLSYLLMLSGLMLLQLAADPSKNDFLPEQMALCLSGRGASLLESLPQQLKTSMWRFLSMFRNKRVASLSLLFSAEKKMEIPVGLSLLQNVYTGLPPASAVPVSIAVRPVELLPEFLLRFRREFPASADILFPGFFTDDYYHPFTDHGEALISSSIDQSFPPVESPRPYDSLSAWIQNLLDLVS